MSAPPESPAERLGARADRALETVRALAAEARPSGGDAEARARSYCADRLRRAGFDVSEEPFEYSAFVGRWGTAIGGIVALAVVLAASAFGRGQNAGLAVAILALGAVLLAAFARALARDGVLRFPAMRERGVNLVATRDTRGEAAGVPTAAALWLMAHLDSKSQPVPILVRAAGVTLVGLTWTLAILIGVVQVFGAPVGATVWLTVSVAALVGAIPVIATTVGSRSPGALDNATGVATVLAVAEHVGAARVSVCLTSAEELGLAGARSWAAGAKGRPGVAVNVDTVDHAGATTCMYSGRKPGALVACVLAAGSRAGSSIRAHRLLPGVLTDGVALADAGWEVVTLSRGSVRTLARIHTPRDRADDLTGAGMDEVARVLIALVESRT